jgi:hypothetical protein
MFVIPSSAIVFLEPNRVATDNTGGTQQVTKLVVGSLTTVCMEDYETVKGMIVSQQIGKFMGVES